MTDQGIIDTIANRIARSSWMAVGMVQESASFILDGLRERYAVVELPEPDYVDDDFDGLGTRGYGWGGVGSTPWGFGTYAASGRVYDDEREVSPKDARVVASWWLAAADAAEADQ